MKALIRKAIWPLIAPANNSGAKRVIVMGFPRSGTSVTGRLVSELGYHFGTVRDVRRGDSENPHGYYEHAEFIRLTERFYKEAGLYIGAPLKLHDTLVSKGLIGKLQRLYTRNRMQRVIARLDMHAKRWAVKIFPHLFYVWAEHFEEAKLVCVYRDPRLAAHSYLKKWPNSQSIDNLINYWSSYNKDMLYHMATHDSFLIKYEDLFDAHKLPTIVEALARFLDAEATESAAGTVDTSRNRAGQFAEDLKAMYPLSAETERVYAILEEKRSY